MPSTATITTFYSFTANTKARASQVNANFDVFRGHLLPLSPSAQAATTMSYDLGSTEYYYRSAHVGGFRMYNQTTTGLGGLSFSIGGVEKYRIPTTFGVTSTAGVGEYAQVNIASAAYPTLSGSVFTITGSTITISTIGRPIEIGFVNNTSSVGFNWSLIRSGVDGTNNYISLLIYVDGVLFHGAQLGQSDTVVAGESLYIYPPPFRKPLSAGTHTISLAWTGPTRIRPELYGVGFYAMES